MRSIFLILIFLAVRTEATTIAECQTTDSAGSNSSVKINLHDEDDLRIGSELFDLNGEHYKMVAIADVRVSGNQVNCGVMGELYYIKSGNPIFLGSQRAQKKCSDPGPLPVISLDEIVNYDLDLTLRFDCKFTEFGGEGEN